MNPSRLLHVSEWIFLIIVMALMATLVVIAKKSGNHAAVALAEFRSVSSRQDIWVDVQGHVKKPGKYKLKPGESVRSILKKAKVKPLADLSQISLSEVPKESICLEIVPLKTISVQVRGCVKKVLDLEVEVGSRICDLKQKIELAPGADKNFLRKKRRLKPGEIIEIPETHK